MEMEIKLTTHNKLETNILDTYTCDWKNIKIETEDYVLDGEIIMEELYGETDFKELNIKYVFMGRIEHLKKNERKTGE